MGGSNMGEVNNNINNNGEIDSPNASNPSSVINNNSNNNPNHITHNIHPINPVLNESKVGERLYKYQNIF